MKIFNSIASLKLATLQPNKQRVARYASERGDAGYEEGLIKTAAQAASDGDIIDEDKKGCTLANGTVWVVSRKQDANLNVVDQTFAGMNTATNGAGVLTGTVEYDCTYYTDDGETHKKALANPLVVSSNKVLITNIPVGLDSRIIGRRIYRNVQGAADVVLKKLVVDIADNTTTQYDDNIADGALGALIPWDNTTGGQLFINDDLTLISNDNCLKVGYEAHPNHTGYANTAVGGFALKANIDGYRATALGLYALTSLEHGAQLTAGGVHAFQYLVVGSFNTAFGYAPAFNLKYGSHNTFMGDEAFYNIGLGFGVQDLSQHTGFGSRVFHNFQGTTVVNKPNTGLGYRAGHDTDFGTGNLMLGAYAGSHGNWSDTCIIDNFDRGNQSNEINNSPVVMTLNSNGDLQKIKFNAALKSANASYYSDVSATAAGWQLNANGTQSYSLGAGTAATNAQVFYAGSAAVGAIQVSSGGTLFVDLSDKNKKENVKPATESAIEELMKIDVVEFDFNFGDKEHAQFGFTAQGLNKTNPACRAVSIGSSDEDFGTAEYKTWGVDNSKLVPMLVKTVQEQQRLIERLLAACDLTL